MSDYISREAMLSLYEGNYDTAEYHVPVPVIIQNIKDIPTADVRPVVKAEWYGEADGYYLLKTKMMTYGQAIMTRSLPQPPEEE